MRSSAPRISSLLIQGGKGDLALRSAQKMCLLPTVATVSFMHPYHLTLASSLREFPTWVVSSGKDQF